LQTITGDFPLVVRHHPRKIPMLTTVSKLLKNEDGATAIEYGLIAALIAVAAIAAFQLVGTNLSSIFNTVATKL
jgi:pilus assembly protein Flp/PilA